MEEQKFEAKWTHIHDQFRAGVVTVVAKRDQAIASLFEESQWTQQMIADKVGKSQSYTCQLMCFGRFLKFIATGNNHEIPSNLTERAFRKYWEQTKGRKETRRFGDVLALMEENCETVVKTPARQIGDQIVSKFADWNWHTLEEIAEEFDTDADDQNLKDTLRRMVERGSFGTRAEKRKAAKDSGGLTVQYRIKKLDSKRQVKASSLADELLEEVRVALDLARDATPAEFSREMVAMYLTKIERHLCEVLGCNPMKPRKRETTDGMRIK